RAYELLGTAYLGRREPAKATDAYRRIVALAPKDPRGPYLIGLGLRAQGKNGEAKKEFEAALALAPGFVEPLGSLAEMSFAEKAPDAAVDRVKQQIVRVPNSGGLELLLGRVYVLRGDWDLAESSFLKALQLEPNLVSAYIELGRLYATSGKNVEALAKLNDALKVAPNDLVALTLSGIVNERNGDIAKAREAYEKVLAIQPRSAAAANNLAYLYSEHGGDVEKALQLAQTAKEIAPDEPHISDTLGWVLYKRGVHHRALNLFKESVSKLPENPAFQYHLGLAYLKVGDSENAKKALI